MCHVTGIIPYDRMFIQVAKDIYVSTPELCLLQLAGSLDVAGVVQLGYELCGHYSLIPDAPHGFVSREVPLTTRSAIESLLDRMRGAHGWNRVRRALPHILEGSRSPMETALAMQLELPRHLGGWGFPAPVLNRRIDLPPVARRLCSRSFVEADLFWPQHRLDLEYDSNWFHRDPSSMAADAEKRAALTATGYDVVSVVWDEVRDRECMDALARGVARRMGLRLSPDTAEDVARRRELRALVLPPVRYDWAE